MITQPNCTHISTNGLFLPTLSSPKTHNNKVASLIQNKYQHTLLSTIQEESINEPIKKLNTNLLNQATSAISTSKLKPMPTNNLVNSPQKKFSEGRKNTLLSSKKIQSLYAQKIKKPISGSNIRLTPVIHRSQSNTSLIMQGTSCFFPSKIISVADLISEQKNTKTKNN